jgi:hypothetical protein
MLPTLPTFPTFTKKKIIMGQNESGREQERKKVGRLGNGSKVGNGVTGLFVIFYTLALTPGKGVR